ncbi:Os10g0375950 [Oryza sativa Japonica Group]|nr:Os10g0375950 [Oryza sativa Japonica Group]
MLLLSSLAKAATAAHWLAAVEEGEPSAARTPTSASLRSAATTGFAKEEHGELNTHRDGVGGGGGRLGQIRGVVSVVGGWPGREGRRVGRLEAVVVPQRSEAKVGLASALGSPPSFHGFLGEGGRRSARTPTTVGTNLARRSSSTAATLGSPSSAAASRRAVAVVEMVRRREREEQRSAPPRPLQP